MISGMHGAEGAVSGGQSCCQTDTRYTIVTQPAPFPHDFAKMLLPVLQLRGDIGVKPTTQPTQATGDRILVVDDEPDIVALVAYHLARAGYRVSTAANGTDALKAARDEQPALIVLDLMLP